MYILSLFILIVKGIHYGLLVSSYIPLKEFRKQAKLGAAIVCLIIKVGDKHLKRMDHMPSTIIRQKN